MRWLRRGLSATPMVAWFALAGCGRTAAMAVGQGGSTAEFMAEANRVAALVSPAHLLVVALVLLAGVLATRLAQRLVEQLWRMGLDRGRRLAVARRIFDLLVVAGLLSWVADRALTAAPLLGGMALVVLTAGALWVFARPLQNVAAGLAIIMRGRIREGDYLAVGDARGSVEEIGLTRLVLRDSEGTAVYVPCQVVEREVARVHRARREVPVSIQVPLDEGRWPAAAEVLRKAACLSPWRVPGTPVRVTVSEDERRATVEVQTWSETAARHLTSQLRSAAAQALRQAEGGEPHPHAATDRGPTTPQDR